MWQYPSLRVYYQLKWQIWFHVTITAAVNASWDTGFLFYLIEICADRVDRISDLQVISGKQITQNYAQRQK